MKKYKWQDFFTQNKISDKDYNINLYELKLSNFNIKFNYLIGDKKIKNTILYIVQGLTNDFYKCKFDHFDSFDKTSIKQFKQNAIKFVQENVKSLKDDNYLKQQLQYDLNKIT